MRTAIVTMSVCTFAALAAAGLAPGAAAAPPPPPPPEVVDLAPDHGPPAGGGTVTVTGTGFVAGDTTVSVGGDYVDADVHGPTELTFVMPPHDAGPVTITVVVSERTSAGAYYLVDGAVPSATPGPTDPAAKPAAQAPVPTSTPRRRVQQRAPRPDAPSVGRPPELAATGTGTGRLALAGIACLALGAALVRTTGSRT